MDRRKVVTGAIAILASSAPVAQLAEASASKSDLWGFESPLEHQERMEAIKENFHLLEMCKKIRQDVIKLARLIGDKEMSASLDCLDKTERICQQDLKILLNGPFA